MSADLFSIHLSRLSHTANFLQKRQTKKDVACISIISIYITLAQHLVTQSFKLSKEKQREVLQFSYQPQHYLCNLANKIPVKVECLYIYNPPISLRKCYDNFY